MKVIDSSLVDLIRCIRTAKLSRKGRLRFEIKRISKEEAQFSELKKDLEEQGTPVEPNSKAGKRTDKADATKPSPPAELLGNWECQMDPSLLLWKMKNIIILSPPFSFPSFFCLSSNFNVAYVH